MSLLVEQFRQRAELAQSEFHEAADWASVASLALELAEGERVAVAPSLAGAAPELIAGLGASAAVPDDDAPAASVADAAVGIVRGELAVAETGSVLVVEDALPDRAVSMLALRLIQVVERCRIVAGLDEVGVWLSQRPAGPGYVALATGPSRTADIERSLTIGVQGPSEVHVVVLG